MREPVTKQVGTVQLLLQLTILTREPDEFLHCFIGALCGEMWKSLLGKPASQKNCTEKRWSFNHEIVF